MIMMPSTRKILLEKSQGEREPFFLLQENCLKFLELIILVLNAQMCFKRSFYCVTYLRQVLIETLQKSFNSSCPCTIFVRQSMKVNFCVHSSLVSALGKQNDRELRHIIREPQSNCTLLKLLLWH